MALCTGAALLVVYLLTLAPGVTFWDAGEFIAAAHAFGIPHPPGTPLFVALGRGWVATAGALVGTARAMNLLSALATAAAGALTVPLLLRDAPRRDGARWGAAAAGLLAGTMFSVWSNATETEVYALALLHVAALLACAAKVDDTPRGARWLSLTLYLIALAPAVHLSALVASPTAAVLAARSRDGRWRWSAALLVTAAALMAAGVGRMSLPLVLLGALLGLASARLQAAGRWMSAAAILMVPLATSALLVLLVRARQDPSIDQGSPVSLHALADLVARRQYAVAGLWPRQGPLWLQAAAIPQYLDWQVAMGWGRGVFSSASRVLATLAYLALGVAGWRAMRRENPRLSLALLTLFASGTVGVAVYLNLKAGASLGWGVVSDALPHEARERDYFFVLGFWAWACLAGWGALALARRAGTPALALAVVLVPLVANWRAADRSRGIGATAARVFAVGLLEAAPRRAVLFLGGDNDSYPLWYLQEVEGARPDVQLVTLPLLPAAWYPEQLARRTGLNWRVAAPPAGAQWEHELVAAAIAASARRAGRPVAASAALTARERGLLGAGWSLQGPLYVSSGNAGTPDRPPTADPARARAWMRRHPAARTDGATADDAAAVMLPLLECPRLALPWLGTRAGRDSLEERCNFR